ncbi:MAG: helix-turn-helix transcriptional regulator [Clostridia bacterium]|nr:helix-turn-helix transcriptional regulator [Clostridia bacterium]
MRFGENFKRCRLEVNLSQKEVAKKLGICQSNVSDWENDISRPDYEKLIQLSKIYDVSICDLLGVDEN